MQAKSAETFTSSSTFLLIVLYVKQASTVLNVNNKFNYKKLVKMVNYKYHQYSLTLQR